MLISLLEKRLSGSLVVQDPAGQKSAFSVQNGSIVKAKTPEPVIRIGDLLVELHALDAKTLERSLRHAKQAGIPLGQSLVRLGAVAEPILDAALAEQLARRVVWACALPSDSRYGFYGGVDFLSAWGAGPIQADPLALIWRSARAHADAGRVSNVLQRLGPRPVRLHAEARLDRFHFGWDDVAALERLKTDVVAVSELLATPGTDRETLERMVYVLALTRHLDLGDGHPPAGIGGASPTGTPRVRSGVTLSGQSEAPPSSHLPLGSAPPGSPVPSIAPTTTASPLGPMTISPPGSAVRRAPATNPIVSARPAAPAAEEPRSEAAPVPRTGWTSPRPTVPASTPSVALESEAPPASVPGSTRVPTTLAPPATARPDPLEWRLNAKAMQCDRNDLYAVLEIDKASPAATVQAAYVKLAKVWHPDRLPAAMAHRKADATRVFSKLAEARRILCDPDLRRTYDSEQEPGDAEEANVSRVVEAAGEFRRAELLAKRNDYATALRHAELAYKAEPDQAEYAALYAYVVVQGASNLEPKRLQQLVEIVDKAAKQDKENMRVRLFRAYVLKRAGRLDDAIRDFKLVAKNDRHNVDALREIRLFNLRQEREQKGGGLFGGIFAGSKPPPKSRS